MTTAIVTIAAPNASTLQQILVDGDLEKLTPEQRLSYYAMRCEAAGLDPKSQPFQFVRLQNKLVLYATRSATQQLAGRNKISTEIKGMSEDGGLISYSVRASRPDGQFADEIGVVSFTAGKGTEFHANARMKALTKAKRRAVLALCGLEMCDESELPDGVHPIPADLAAPTARAVPPYMDADKSSRLRAICNANKIPAPEVNRMTHEATGGRVVDRTDNGVPLFSQSEYETLAGLLKSWKAPAAQPAAQQHEAAAMAAEEHYAAQSAAESGGAS